jgi:hypothetical protein
VGPIRNGEGYWFEPCYIVVGCPVSTMSPSVSPRRWFFISRSPNAQLEMSATSSIFGIALASNMYIDSHSRQYPVSRAGTPGWFAMPSILSMPVHGYSEGNEVGNGESTGNPLRQ